MKATEKLASINPITVYSDSIKNRDIEDVYKDLESEDITKEDYFMNVVNLQRFWTLEGLTNLEKKPSFEDVHDR